jgi:hypothetical protein
MRKTWKEAAMACFKVPLPYGSKRTEENHQSYQSGESGPQKRMVRGTSREHDRRITIRTNVLGCLIVYTESI